MGRFFLPTVCEFDFFFNLIFLTLSVCADYDLCEDCESQEGVHDSSHFFAKLHLYLPGLGRKNGEMVPILKNFAYKAILDKEANDEQTKESKKVEKRKERAERKEKMMKEWKLLAKETKREEKIKKELHRKKRMEMKQM